MSRKRHLEDEDANELLASKKQPLPFLPLGQLRLEAVFHPKFENENRQEQLIRNRMKECTTAQGGAGYLEVSLKHSGSLLLWSGGSRYYSKNSTDNKFTAAGEILLRQHFVRAFWMDAIDDDESSQQQLAETMYQKCSDHVQENRLTLSFEVVTDVLGDHGARPIRDFLILTAVADRSRQQSLFYSTVEIIELAQKFRLPHNDCWVYTSEPAVEALFDFYDNFRETATTSTVIPALTNAANAASNCNNYFVQSMYPHADFQGEIMEGIVIRYVQCEDRDAALQRLARLSQQSRAILLQVPPRLGACFELLQRLDVSNAQSPPPALTTNLRQLYQETKAAFSRNGADKFESHLLKRISDSPVVGFRSSDSNLQRQRCMERIPRSLVDVPLWMNDLLSKDPQSFDFETRQIASLIRSLSSISQKVVYSVFRERSSCPALEQETSRFICIIHVLHDQTFQKFEKQRSKGSMPLFRGFSFELIGNSQGNGAMTCTSDTDTSIMLADDDGGKDMMDVDKEETLMLKMKFLPYMVRTFGCRNGLTVLRQGGPTAFIKFTNGLLLKWGISQTAQQTWKPFFRAWAHYAQQCIAGKQRIEAKVLPTLTEFNYLDHLELFQDLYNSGKISTEPDGVSSCSLQGLVVVVAVERKTAKAAADCIADHLGGAERFDDMAFIDANLMALACESGRGYVCSAIVEDGFGGIRKLLKNYSEFISLVLFQCAEKDVSEFLLPSDTERKVINMLKGWRKTRCSQTFELPLSSLFDPDGMSIDEGQRVQPSDEFVEMISKLQRSQVLDERPGLLVFFPSIPGSGKSACVSNIERELNCVLQSVDARQNRNVIVQVGDKTKKKFWPLVKRTRLKDRPCIYIADKNAPFSIWDYIGEISATSKALAIPVLPDASALTTTRVDGLRKPDGSIISEGAHIYPFSLQYLAVCIARVMERPAGSHAGKLDASTFRACMIVTKFFSFYRTISADKFFETLTAKMMTAGALITPAPIEIPFFKSGRGNEPLPDDLQDVLIEALRCQYGYDCENADPTREEDPYLDDVEKRIRECIQCYSDQILGLAAEETVSRQSFASSLIQKITEADSVVSYEAPSFIKIACIDVDVNVVHQLLHDLAADKRFSSFFENSLQGYDVNDVLSGNGACLATAEECKFVLKTHVTLAHFRRMSQSDLRSTFKPLCGSIAKLSATGFIWSERVAALAVNVARETADGVCMPCSRNTFPHITVWYEEGASAVDANDLPDLFTNGKACRVDFESPVSLEGIISFWEM